MNRSLVLSVLPLGMLAWPLLLHAPRPPAAVATAAGQSGQVADGTLLAAASLPATPGAEGTRWLALERQALQPGETVALDEDPGRQVFGPTLLYVESGEVLVRGAERDAAEAVATGSQAVATEATLENATNECASVLILTVGDIGAAAVVGPPASGLPLTPGLDCGDDERLLGPGDSGMASAEPVVATVTRARWTAGQWFDRVAADQGVALLVEEGAVSFQDAGTGVRGRLPAGGSLVSPKGTEVGISTGFDGESTAIVVTLGPPD